MGKIKNKNNNLMKFAFLAVAFAAECTDDTAADCGEAPGCCGFLTDAEGVESRVCSEDGAVPTDGEEGTFTCEAMMEEEGSAKLALGAAFLPPLSTCEIAVDRSCHFYDTCYHQRLKDLIRFLPLK